MKTKSKKKSSKKPPYVIYPYEQVEYENLPVLISKYVGRLKKVDSAAAQFLMIAFLYAIDDFCQIQDI